ncbi:MAG TPA: hypothetical protein VMT69_11725 [Kineosporiaceae bacterium]|nr:hypothetical protein [Kineosporiaceae bacterium]
MTSHTEETRALDADERAELERLRAEVARLQDEAGSGPPSKGRPPRSARHWGRTLGAVLLILVACLLAPLSVTSVWARSQVTDTSRYVETVAPLAEDPTIQQAVTNKLTNLVFQYVDVQSITTQALTALQQRGVVPPALATQLQALAVPLASGVQSFTHDRIQQVVQSDVFAQAWEQANRTAHQQVVAALTGQSSAVKVQNNTVTVDLGPFLDVVKQKLVDNGFQLAARIPSVNATFTVFESTDVTTLQRGFNLLNTLGYWLPFILVALAGLGIYLAPNHRLAFIWTGIGVSLAALVTAIALQVVRQRYLDGVPATVLPPDAAAVLFDTVVRFLREAIRALALLGVIVALGAFLTGPSVTAVTLRRWSVSAFAAAKGGLADVGLDLDGVTRWVAPRARVLRGVVVAVAFAVLLLAPYRTPSLVLWVTAGVLVALAIIELLAVEPRRREHAPSAVPAPAGAPG